MMDGDADTVRELFQRLDDTRKVPEKNALRGILDAARESLNNEDPSIRPRDDLGRPGGLVVLEQGITTVIVPDLHARTGYMRTLLDLAVNGIPLLESLLAGSLQVVCVGDGFHSEARGAGRWKDAWKEYKAGFRRHSAMDSEMAEGLGLMAMVMILKAAAPGRFHFLKGNHENVMNTEEGGNRPFGKYAWEGQMVKDWFSMFLGDEMLSDWASFEASLPLLAVGDRFLVSHAEPRSFYGRSEVINCRGDDEVIFGFTWTGNDESRDGTVADMLAAYLGADEEGSLYFGGHRPVRKKFGLRASERYVQIHNPDEYVVSILEPGRAPDAERDVFIMEREGERQ